MGSSGVFVDVVLLHEVVTCYDHVSLVIEVGPGDHAPHKTNS